jgi:hypothetical protein
VSTLHDVDSWLWAIRERKSKRLLWHKAEKLGFAVPRLFKTRQEGRDWKRANCPQRLFAVVKVQMRFEVVE